MKKKSTVLVVFFLIAAIFLVSAQTEKKYVLKFGHVLTTQILTTSILEDG